MKPKYILHIMPIVATCLLISGGCHKGIDSNTQRVGIGTFSEAIDYAPYYIAKHFNWFEDELKKAGVDAKIDYRQFNDFDAIKAALAGNKLHAFFAAEAPIAKLRSEKDPMKIVEVGCTLQQEIVVRADSNISKVRDLKNRNIAVAFGTSSHYGLLKILTASGLSGDDVTIKFGFPDTAKIAFEKKDVVAWAVWPPFVEEQVTANRGYILPGGDAKIQSVMALHVDILSHYPKIGRALHVAITRAKEWISANPLESQTIIAKQLFLKNEIVKSAWPKHSWGAALTDDVINDVKDKVRFLISVDVVNKNAITDIDAFVEKDLIVSESLSY